MGCTVKQGVDNPEDRRGVKDGQSKGNRPVLPNSMVDLSFKSYEEAQGKCPKNHMK